MRYWAPLGAGGPAGTPSDGAPLGIRLLDIVGHPLSIGAPRLRLSLVEQHNPEQPYEQRWITLDDREQP
jgi:hypothetical protein